MKSLADGLPAEIARQIHPDWHKNEAAYWAVREQLLEQYQGQWIGFADGKVIASGARPVLVLHAAVEAAEHPFVTCVGHEDRPTRMRRATFPYDTNYPGEALPVSRVEFRAVRGGSGVVFDQVILDTGADASALPWADCQKMNLSLSKGLPGTITGAAGGSANTLTFVAWVLLDGKEYQCELHADFTGFERILGRDILNSLEVLFRGPAREIVVNP